MTEEPDACERVRTSHDINDTLETKCRDHHHLEHSVRWSARRGRRRRGNLFRPGRRLPLLSSRRRRAPARVQIRGGDVREPSGIPGLPSTTWTVAEARGSARSNKLSGITPERACARAHESALPVTGKRQRSFRSLASVNKMDAQFRVSRYC